MYSIDRCCYRDISDLPYGENIKLKLYELYQKTKADDISNIEGDELFGLETSSSYCDIMLFNAFLDCIDINLEKEKNDKYGKDKGYIDTYLTTKEKLEQCCDNGFKVLFNKNNIRKDIFFSFF